MRLSIGLIVVAAAFFVTEASAAPCKKKGGRARVFVKAKTPLRRGPGLNYGVSKFIEKGRCTPYSEVSLDEQWVLLEIERGFGWVPVRRLSKTSQRKLARTGQTGPIGSGQTRATARLLRQSVMVERPDPRAPGPSRSARKSPRASARRHARRSVDPSPGRAGRHRLGCEQRSRGQSAGRAAAHRNAGRGTPSPPAIDIGKRHCKGVRSVWRFGGRSGGAGAQVRRR